MTSSAEAAPGRERLVDQAYRQIRDAIVAVRLQPGAPLDELWRPWLLASS